MKTIRNILYSLISRTQTRSTFKKVFTLLSLPLISLTFAREVNASPTWVVRKTHWSVADEKAYQEFVISLGTAVANRSCGSIASCMKSAANPFRKSDPPGVSYFADCADLPYFLRAYFSWKNQLPFAYVNDVNPAKGSIGSESGELNRDIRYTPNGNLVASRKNILGGTQGNPIKLIESGILSDVSSATFRMNYKDMDKGLFSDFYSTRLDRSGIIPGTNLYDPAGHVAVVYKITDDGHIYYMDAHPDNSLTTGIYSPKFSRSRPSQGAGFKNWRPLNLVDAQTDANGDLIGGKIVGARDQNLKDFSNEQYYGTDPDRDLKWQKGTFKLSGQSVDYYDYLRAKMAIGELKINPVEEIKTLTNDVCVSLKDRVTSVDSALRSSVAKTAHPDRLPFNIYGTEGSWEEYSSPSRDARLKVSYKDVLDQAKSLISKYNQKDASIVYEGTQIAQDMLEAYKATASACVITYTNSKGAPVNLDLETVRKRLFDLSFDPYHCAELRWGARGDEASSCQDDENKVAWYRQEKWMRNQIERTYDARMDYKLEELDGPKPKAGVANPPDTDIISFLSGVQK